MREDKETPSYRVKALCFGGDAAYWSVQRLLPIIRPYAKPKRKPWIDVRDLADLGGIRTRFSALETVTQQRLVNWGYLSAHYSLGFVNKLLLCSQVRRLTAECRLPYGGEGVGIGQYTKTDEYCLLPIKCDPTKPELPAD
jgi:hypothetical protein